MDPKPERAFVSQPAGRRASHHAQRVSAAALSFPQVGQTREPVTPSLLSPVWVCQTKMFRFDQFSAEWFAPLMSRWDEFRDVTP
jgi:hypothetical protein